MNGLLGSGRNYRKWNLVGRRGSWGLALEDSILFLTSSFLCLCLAIMSWASVSTTRFFHVVLPHLRPKAVKPADHGLTTLKPWAKIIISSFTLFFSDIYHSNEKLTDTLTLRLMWGTQSSLWVPFWITPHFLEVGRNEGVSCFWSNINPLSHSHLFFCKTVKKGKHLRR